MKTNSFKASTVFKLTDDSVKVSLYPAGIKTSDEVEVSMHSIAKVNCFLAKDCHFLLYEKHNPSVTFKDEDEYVVEDENQDYHLVAFLGKKEDVLDNDVDIVAKLPKGLKMQKQFAFDFNIFCFSGFSVMLFEEEPKFN